MTAERRYTGTVAKWSLDLDRGIVRLEDDGREVPLSGTEYGGYITCNEGLSVSCRLVTHGAGWRAIDCRPANAGTTANGREH